MANPPNDQDDELKASQDRIKKLEEENRKHELEELIQEEIKEDTSSFKEQIKEHGEELEKKMKWYLSIALGAVAIATFFLHYLGSDQITKLVNETITTHAKPQIDALILKENHNADSIVSARADSLVNILVNTKADSIVKTLVNEKGDKMLKELRAEMEKRIKAVIDTSGEELHKLIAKLSSKKINPDKPISKEVRKELSKATEMLAKSNKEESKYSFDEWFVKASAELVKKDTNNALNSFSMALEKDPSSADAYRYRGDIYYGLNKYDKAKADYDKAIELKPDAGTYNNRGLCYYSLKQYKNAIEDYDVAIKLNSNNAKAYNNRGLAYKGLQLYEKAIDDYDKAIKYDSKYAGAYYNRAIARDAINKPVKAKADRDKARQLDPVNYK